MSCVEGSVQNPKCYTLETFDFFSEEQIFDIILDVLKSELPPRLKAVKDCQNKPMYIAEESIDLIPSDNDPRFEVILNPLSAVPSYNQIRTFRTVQYNFELILTVRNELARCITWELTRFKNVVEGLIVGSEFVIDGYNSVEVEPGQFTYYVPEVAGKAAYIRQGTYKFAVTVSQYRN